GSIGVAHPAGVALVGPDARTRVVKLGRDAQATTRARASVGREGWTASADAAPTRGRSIRRAGRFADGADAHVHIGVGTKREARASGKGKGGPATRRQS